MRLTPPTSSSPATERRFRAAIAFAALVVALFAIAGCGGDSEDSEPQANADADQQAQGGVIDISGTDAVGESLAGSVAPLVECRDWNAATDDEKIATIDDVRSQISRQDVGIRSPRLSDEEAMTIFDNTCEPPWAQGFRLYKLYARAAAFAPLARQLER